MTDNTIHDKLGAVADAAVVAGNKMREVGQEAGRVAAAMGRHSALQVMLAAAAAEDATEQSVLDSIAPYLPEDADTGRLRVLARGFIKDAGIARHRAEQMQDRLAVALAGYPYNLGPAPVIVDAAPFIDRPSVFTRKDAA